MLQSRMSVIEIYKIQYGEESELVGTCYLGLVEVYNKLNNPEKAKEAALKYEELCKKPRAQA